MDAGPAGDSPSFPERIGRYELLLPIGTGGMATVYLARFRVVDDAYRQVALKLLHPFLKAGGEDGTQALVDEAKLAVRIRHPNVVPVVEVGDGPNGLFLVMDYIEGDTLSGVMRSLREQKQTLPLPIAGRVLLDALAGLHAAHELKDDEGRALRLVHRDFSPQNILIGTDGVSRLTDFGVAKADNRAQVTTSGVIKGKVGYMSPEQALGKTVDRHCDIWAAGVVTWEILAGRRMYKEHDQVATLLKIVNEVPPRLSSVRPSIPTALDEVIAEALNVDVAKRISTAQELRRWLAAAWNAQGPIADAAQVSEFITRLTAQKLEARADQISRVLRLRSGLAQVKAEATLAAAERASNSGVGSVTSGPDDTTSAISASSLGSSSGAAAATAVPSHAHWPARWVAVAGLSVGVIGIGAAIWAASTQRASGPATPSAPTPGASAMASVAPITAPTAAPTATSAAAPVEQVTIHSDTRLRSLKLDGQPLKIAPGALRFVLPLDAGQRGRALKLEAGAADGRRLSRDVTPTGEDVTLTFPTPARSNAPAPTTGKPVLDTAPTGKPVQLPRLAPTPYQSK